MRRLVRLSKSMMSSSVGIGGGVGGAIVDGDGRFWPYEVGWNVMAWESWWLLFFFCSVYETANKNEYQN